MRRVPFWCDEKANNYSTNLRICEEFSLIPTYMGHLRYGGVDTKHKHGVGFIVNKEGSVISCTPIFGGFITIHVAARLQNITVIQIYAPMLEYDDDNIVEKFYEDLKKITKVAPPQNVLLVLGMPKQSWLYMINGLGQWDTLG